MKGRFNGEVNMNVDLSADGGMMTDAPVLLINQRPVSLTAIAAVSPSMLAVLEELAKPESDGAVFRVERDGPEVRLIKTGLLAQVGARLAAALPRQRVRA